MEVTRSEFSQSNKFPANPEHDTNCFHLAFEEWKIENECPLAEYEELPLAARSHIMRRANELKFAEKSEPKAEKPSPKFITHDPKNHGQAPEFLSPYPTAQEISDGVMRGRQHDAGCYE